MSLRDCDTAELCAIHPERLQPRPQVSASTMQPPPTTDGGALQPALNNFQDKLGSNSRMSLSTVDTTLLTAPHPENLPPPPIVAHMPSRLTEEQSAPLPPALTNFQNELGSNSKLSLSNVDTTELTAIHPRRNYRPQFSRDTTYMPPIALDGSEMSASHVDTRELSSVRPREN
jgi:hypothetical protein